MKHLLLWIFLTGCLTAGGLSATLAAQGQGQEPAATDLRPAESPAAICAAREWIHRSGAVLDLGLAAGVREDRLDWNIAGDRDGQNPDVLSEMKWRNLEIGQVKLNSKFTLPRVVHLRGSFGYGWIVNGDNRDSDYLGDNRTFEYSRTDNHADHGSVFDFSGAAGYPLAFGREVTITLRPLIGYSYHRQNLTITDGNQTIATPGLTPGPGPFSGLDSHYDASWYGPWVGLEVEVGTEIPGGFIQRVEGFFGFEYHHADYRAQADWNLRQDLAHPNSFRHRADGVGYVFAGGLNLFFTPQWALTTEVVYQDWSTHQGRHRVYFADGGTASTQLNEVNWRSFGLGLGVTYRF
jgi:hypothetical protein